MDLEQLIHEIEEGRLELHSLIDLLKAAMKALEVANARNKELEQRIKELERNQSENSTEKFEESFIRRRRGKTAARTRL